MAAGRNLTIEINVNDAQAHRSLQRVEVDLKGVAHQAERSGSALKQTVATFGGFLGAQAALSAVTHGVRALGTVVFGMNSTLETAELQFGTLMGSADKAKAHVRDLFEIAKKTPFETGPILEASRMLQTFGGSALNTKKNILLIGDAAAATSAPINELGFWVGRMYAAIKGGQPFGEAAMRLQELAVLTPQVRQQMEAMQKAGRDADAVFSVFTTDIQRFDGAMEKQAGTWSGLMSTFKDSLNMALSQGFRPLFSAAQEYLGKINQWLSSDAASEWAESIGRYVSGTLVPALKDVGTVLVEMIWPPIEKLGSAGIKIVSDLAKFWREMPEPMQKAAVALAEVGTALWVINSALAAIKGSAALSALSAIAASPALAALAAAAVGGGLVWNQLGVMQRQMAGSMAGASTGPIDPSKMTIAQAQAAMQAKYGAQGAAVFSATLGGAGGATPPSYTPPGKGKKTAEANYGPWAQTFGLWWGSIRKSDLIDNPYGEMPSKRFAGIPIAPSVTGGRGEMTGVAEGGTNPSIWTGESGVLSQLGPTILSALQGGGSVTRSAGGLFGGGLGDTLKKSLGSFESLTGIGKVLGSVLPGIGTLIGSGLGSLVGGLFGKSKGKIAGENADAEIKALQSDLLSTYGSLDKIRQMGGAAGVELANAWGSKNVAGLETFKKKLDAFKAALNIQSEIDALNAQLASLKQSQIPTWDQIKAAADRYGLTIAGLGQKAQQLSVNDASTNLLNDWNTLTAAGMEADAVAKAMGKDLNQLVIDSQKYGVTLPENMRPVLESLAKQGLLVGDNGKKLEDLTGLKFGAPVVTEADKIKTAMDGVVKKLDELIAKLTGLDGKEVKTTVTTHYRKAVDPDAPPEPYHSGGLVHRAYGGGARVLPFPLVRAHRGLAVDEVPIIAQTGERVLSREQNRRWEAGQRGGGATTIRVPVVLDGRQVTEVVARHLPGVLRVRGAA